MNALDAIGPTEIHGLPVHILLVHVTVVVLPAAAAATVASAAWPAARRRLGVVTPLLALIALICVPLTVSAGQWFFRRVGHTPLVLKHQQLGHGLLPWAIALFAVAALEYVWFRFATPRPDPARVLRPRGRSAASRAKPTSTVGVLTTVLATVLALAVGAGTVVQVYRIGESGSRAVWQGNFSPNPRPGQ